jgi:hypothetical protein
VLGFALAAVAGGILVLSELVLADGDAVEILT